MACMVHSPGLERVTLDSAPRAKRDTEPTILTEFCVPEWLVRMPHQFSKIVSPDTRMTMFDTTLVHSFENS